MRVTIPSRKKAVTRFPQSRCGMAVCHQQRRIGMSRSKYKETERFHDGISPSGTFNGDEIVRIRNTETGEVKTGRGHTYEQARDKAMSKHIESGKRK